MRAAAVVALAVIAGACAKQESSSSAVALDGSPRVPDAEGVVVSASPKGLTLNGGRRYKVSPKLVAFSTYDLKPVALASTVHQYVQIGVDDDTVVWLAQIGIVQTGADGKRTTLYQGSLTRVSANRLYFRDGTVLRLAPGLHAPGDATGQTLAYIDVDRGVVQGATLPPAPTTTTRPENS